MPHIFHLHPDGSMAPVKETAYPTEAVLQELLARYPEILAGEDESAGPRRWLLIQREAGLPGADDGGIRWSVDHLFVDQNAIPTIVEVKRSSDTRIRREVVGQMIDYAANAVVYWNPAELRRRFEQTCTIRDTDPEQEVAGFIGSEEGVDAFWESLGANLRDGKLRLVFVSDDIPPELRRSVEFLNEQMQRTEVIAVEVRQFVGEGVTTLVPQVLGATRRAAPKSAAASRQWDKASFFEDLHTKKGEAAVSVASRLYTEAERLLPSIVFGKGARDGSYGVGYSAAGQRWSLFAIYTNGWIEVHFQYLRTRPPFDSPDLRRELFARLCDIPGFKFDDTYLELRPSFLLSVLEPPRSMENFLAIMAWFRETLDAFTGQRGQNA